MGRTTAPAVRPAVRSRRCSCTTPTPARSSQMRSRSSKKTRTSARSRLTSGPTTCCSFIEHTCGFPAKYTCTEGQVATEFGHIAENVGFILGQLRAAAPERADRVRLAVQPVPAGAQARRQRRRVGRSAQQSPQGRRRGLWASFANITQTFNYSGTHGGEESGDIPTVCAFTAMCPGGTYQPGEPSSRHSSHQARLRRDGVDHLDRLPGELITRIDFVTH